MNTNTITVFGKRVFSIYVHDIMRISYRKNNIKQNTDLSFMNVTNDYKRMRKGTYNVQTAQRIVKKNSGKCDVFVFFNENKEYVGTLSIMYKGGHELEYKINTVEAFIYNVYVEEEYRVNGYLSQMIWLIMNELSRKGINSAYLAVSKNNYSAIRAYNKAGFIREKSSMFFRVLRINIPYKCI